MAAGPDAGPALGPAEHRVKVKAPKSGSERLELVLAPAAPATTAAGTANGGPPHLYPWDDRDDVDCAPQNYYDAGPAIDGQVDYCADPDQLLLHCPSSHSASTAETDNRTGSDKGLGRTWSMASDDHGNLRYVSDREGGDEVVYDGVTPRAGKIADEVVTQLLSEGQNQTDGDQAGSGQSSKPQEPANNNAKLYQKAVSFDLSQESDADPTVEAAGSPPTSANAEKAEPGVDQMMDMIRGAREAREKELHKLAAAPSEDTSVESVGDRVVQSFSKEQEDQENQPPPSSSDQTVAKKKDPPTTEACSVLTEPASAATATSGRSSPLKQIKGVLRKPKYSKSKRKGNKGKGAGSTTSSMASNESSRVSSLTNEVGGAEEGAEDGAKASAPRPVAAPKAKEKRKPPARSVSTIASTITRHPSYDMGEEAAPEEAEETRCRVAAEEEKAEAAKEASDPVVPKTKPPRQNPPRPTTQAAAPKAKGQKKPPARSVSTITRHPSYMQDAPALEEAPPRVPPSPSMSTRTRHPSYAIDDPSNESGVAPMVDDDDECDQPELEDDGYYHHPHRHHPEPPHHPQPTFHHRRTLPRDHPSRAAHRDRPHPRHRPTLPRNPSNVSESSFRSDAARDGYVPPSRNRRGTAERAAAGLLRTARKMDKKTRKLKRRVFGKKARESRNGRHDAPSPRDGRPASSTQTSLYGHHPSVKTSLHVPSPPTSLYDDRGHHAPSSAQPSPYDVDDAAERALPRSPGASPAPSPHDAPPTTRYAFEGYDRPPRSPGGAGPPMETLVAPTPRAREATAAAARADGRRSSGMDFAGGDHLLSPSSIATEANPWAAPPTAANPWAEGPSAAGPPLPPARAASALANVGGRTIPPPNAEPNPFVAPMSPPHGEYRGRGTGMPSVKWWTWSQPEDGGAAMAGRAEGKTEDSTYFAFLCAFPGAR